MTSDITAQLAALALQTDDQTHIDAVVACTRYCGARATPAQAHAFALEQVQQLAGFDDSLSADVRRGWRWLARRLEAMIEEEPVAIPDPEAEAEPGASRRRIALRRTRIKFRSEAPSEASI